MKKPTIFITLTIISLFSILFSFTIKLNENNKKLKILIKQYDEDLQVVIRKNEGYHKSYYSYLRYKQNLGDTFIKKFPKFKKDFECLFSSESYYNDDYFPKNACIFSRSFIKKYCNEVDIKGNKICTLNGISINPYFRVNKVINSKYQLDSKISFVFENQ